MEKSNKIIILITILSFIFMINCYASDITEINTLIEDASKLDNKVLTIQGEVIGEVMERGDYAWINVNDGTNAIGVFVNKNDISKIEFCGDYKHKGDIVKITGTFYNACKEHGGEFDIHCSNIEIVKKGQVVKEEISHIKIMATSILLIIAIIILIIYIRLQKLKA